MVMIGSINLHRHTNKQINKQTINQPINPSINQSINQSPLSLKYFLEAANMQRDDKEEHATLTTVPSMMSDDDNDKGLVVTIG
jgi:hypothetical protein